MIQHFCDRCGKKMSEKERKDAHYQIRHADKSSSPYRWTHIWCDICEKCGNELDEWLKNGGK